MLLPMVAHQCRFISRIYPRWGVGWRNDLSLARHLPPPRRMPSPNITRFQGGRWADPDWNASAFCLVMRRSDSWRTSSFQSHFRCRCLPAGGSASGSYGSSWQLARCAPSTSLRQPGGAAERAGWLPMASLQSCHHERLASNIGTRPPLVSAAMFSFTMGSAESVSQLPSFIA